MKVLEIPFSGGGLGKTRGCEKAPARIVEELSRIFMNEHSVEPRLSFSRVGIDSGNIDAARAAIKSSFASLGTSQRIAALGGDHAVTGPCFEAFAAAHKNAGLIVFDAHPDAMDSGFFSHEDFVRNLVEEGFLRPENLVLMGLRSMHRKELNYLRSKKIRFFTCREIFEEGIQETTDTAMSIAKDFGSSYISVDIDVLDPAFAPGVAYPEPGGLSTRELLYMLGRLLKVRNVGALDVTEVNPDRDIGSATVRAAAKIVAEAAD